MDLQTKIRIEKEHQHFGFSSDDFIEGLRGLLKEVTCESGLNSVVKMLRKKLSPCAADPESLEKGLDEMAESLRCSYDRGVDYAVSKAEPKLREFFHIPQHLLLPEDRIVSTVENIDSEQLDAEIAELNQELKNLAVLIEEAKEEQYIADETLTFLEEALALKVEHLPKHIL